MATIPVPMVTENHLYRNSVRNGHLRRRFTHDGLKLRTTLRQPTLYLDGLRSRCASASGRDVEFIARKISVQVELARDLGGGDFIYWTSAEYRSLPTPFHHPDSMQWSLLQEYKMQMNCFFLCHVSLAATTSEWYSQS